MPKKTNKRTARTHIRYPGNATQHGHTTYPLKGNGPKLYNRKKAHKTENLSKDEEALYNISARIGYPSRFKRNPETAFLHLFRAVMRRSYIQPTNMIIHANQLDPFSLDDIADRFAMGIRWRVQNGVTADEDIKERARDGVRSLVRSIRDNIALVAQNPSTKSRMCDMNMPVVFTMATDVISSAALDPSTLSET